MSSEKNPQKSIVLITVDCLRADHVGFLGYDRPTTPSLDSLARESFVFPAAIVAGAPTYYSFPAIMASRYPLSLGRDVLGLAAGEATLASTLKQAGYATASFSADNPFISSRFGYDQSFDTFRDLLIDELAAASESGMPATGTRLRSRLNRQIQKLASAWEPLKKLYDEVYFQYGQRAWPAGDSLDALRRFPAADVIVDQARAWLSSIGNQPFFLWLHLMDPHAPYYPKESAIALMKQASMTPARARYLNASWNRGDLGPSRLASYRDEIVGLYDAGIRWMDVQVARLIEGLRGSNRWDDCIFALTADHGEEFLEHGGRFHAPDQLTEELIRVPLLLRVPGAVKKGVSKSPFSLLHLAPTLLDAAQLSVPSAFAGRSQWPRVREGSSVDDLAVSEIVAGCVNPFRPENRFGPRALSIRDSRFKLVLYFNPPAEHLYDLESDPGEQAPLAATAQKPVRRRLLEVAREHLRHSSGRRDQRTRARARLRELQLEWARSFPQRPAS